MVTQAISTIMPTDQSQNDNPSPKFTMPLNTSDAYVDLDSFPSKMYLTPSVSYQIDNNG
jgi:hypothetical protein